MIKRKKLSEDEITDIINKYGAEILATPEYAIARTQVHHHRTTLEHHMLDVTRQAIKIANRMMARGREVDMEGLVKAALCHDISMAGRHNKYKNNFQNWYRHPLDSAREADRILGGIDKKTYSAIESHMWPFGLVMPTSREAFILIRADKIVSIKDALGISTRRHMKADL